MTEETLTKLSRFKDLAVLGGKSARSLPATADPQSIAHEMATRYLVTGSLRLSGPEIHVNGRLVDARTGMVLSADLLLIHGRDDPLIPATESLALAAAVPPGHAEVFVVGNLSHVDIHPGAIPDTLELWRVAYRLLTLRNGLTVPDARSRVRHQVRRRRPARSAVS